MTKVARAMYRHRGYECPSCKGLNEVFGQDAQSLACMNCTFVAADLAEFKLDWDHTVVVQSTVVPYVAPPLLPPA
jgi:thiol-disulfide isomerase/thioredoxin